MTFQIDLENFHWDEIFKAVNASLPPAEQLTLPMQELLQAACPIEAIKTTHLSPEAKNKLATDLFTATVNLNPETHTADLFRMYGLIKKEGGTLSPTELSGMECVLAVDMHEKFAGTAEADRVVTIEKELAPLKEHFDLLGLNSERIAAMAKDKAVLEEAMPGIGKMMETEAHAAHLGAEAHELMHFDIDEMLNHMKQELHAHAGAEAAEMIEAIRPTVKTVLPIEQIRQLPISIEEKNKLLQTISNNLAHGDVMTTTLDSYAAIKKAGGVIEPAKLKQLELFFATSGGPEAANQIDWKLSNFESSITTLGLDKEYIKKVAGDPAFAMTEMTREFPEATAYAEKMKTAAAEASKKLSEDVDKIVDGAGKTGADASGVAKEGEKAAKSTLKPRNKFVKLFENDAGEISKLKVGGTVLVAILAAVGIGQAVNARKHARENEEAKNTEMAVG